MCSLFLQKWVHDFKSKMGVWRYFLCLFLHLYTTQTLSFTCIRSAQLEDE